MIFCTYCGRGFSRSEHVQRHILTHTKVRPFECKVCYLTFTRRELLQKHYRTHGDQITAERPEDVDTASSARPRIAVACLNCARSKTKCDHRHPCSRCQQKGLSCVSRKPLLHTPGTRDPSVPIAPSDDDPDNGANDFGGDWPSQSSLSSAAELLRNSTSEPAQSSGNPSRVDGDGQVTDLSHDTELCGSEIFVNENTSIDWEKVFSPSQWQLTTTEFAGEAMHGFQSPLQDQPESDINESGVSHLDNGTLEGVTHSRLQYLQSDALSIGSPVHDVPGFNSDNVEEQPSPRDWEFWTLAQCVPPPKELAPLRGKENMLLFAESCKNWAFDAPTARTLRDQPFKDARLTEATRERVSAIVQSVFQTSLHTHGSDAQLALLDFLPLPPTDALYGFSLNYLLHCDIFYPFVPKQALNPNRLMDCRSVKGATLLLLLMISFGAMKEPSPGPRPFVRGLLEMCRLALMERMDKHGSVVTDPELTVQCGLLYTLQAAWSGDKWQMDIGVGHRHIYITILRNVGFLELTPPRWVGTVTNHDGHQLWEDWHEYETKSRLVYAWVIADQELSLFYDTPPLLSTTEIGAAVPANDALWLASNVSDWQRALGAVDDSVDSTIAALHSLRRVSLRELFQLLFSDRASREELLYLGPFQLRLLLFPLHSLICHFHQSLDFCSTTSQPPQFHKSATQMSTMMQQTEIKSLLKRWLDLFDRQHEHAQHRSEGSVLHNATLVVYHLININLFTSIKDIESFARGDGSSAGEGYVATLQSQWFYEAEEVLVHCGQVLRQLRSMDPSARPVWWAAAGYRATLVLWAHCMSQMLMHQHGPYQISQTTSMTAPDVPIDTLPFSHQAVRDFLEHRHGTPKLTRLDGSHVGLDDPSVVMATCLEGLDARPVQCPVWEGIKRKFKAMSMARNSISWSLNRGVSSL